MIFNIKKSFSRIRKRIFNIKEYLLFIITEVHFLILENKFLILKFIYQYYKIFFILKYIQMSKTYFLKLFLI